MQRILTETYEHMSRTACDIILNDLRLNSGLLLCAATGHSPQLTYQYLSETSEHQASCFNSLRVIKLDEWGGMHMDCVGTCETFLQTHLIGPLGITPDRYTAFVSDATDAQAECRRIGDVLSQQGPIDLCILGLGANGHVALNEPGNALHPEPHVAALSAVSLQHAMLRDMGQTVTYGLTLGMANILQSRHILMLVTGQGKQAVAESFLQGQVTTQCPASFLHLHPNVTCVIDQETISKEGNLRSCQTQIE